MWCASAQGFAPAASASKIQFDRISFDATGGLDTTNRQFRPQASGFYDATAQLAVHNEGTTTASGFVSLYRSGVEVARGGSVLLGRFASGQVLAEDTVPMGPSDWLEVFFTQRGVAAGLRMDSPGPQNNYLTVKRAS
jgi:hypothetical protein